MRCPGSVVILHTKNKSYDKWYENLIVRLFAIIQNFLYPWFFNLVAHKYIRTSTLNKLRLQVNIHGKTYLHTHVYYIAMHNALLYCKLRVILVLSEWHQCIVLYTYLLPW